MDSDGGRVALQHFSAADLVAKALWRSRERAVPLLLGTARAPGVQMGADAATDIHLSRAEHATACELRLGGGVAAQCVIGEVGQRAVGVGGGMQDVF